MPSNTCRPFSLVSVCLFMAAGALIGRPALAADGSVTITATTTHVIGNQFYSTNVDPYMTWAGNNSFFTDATIRNLARAQQYGCIRIPGGEEADGYHWLTGKFNSPSYTIPVDVYLAFAEASGSQVQCVVNSGANIAGNTIVTSRMEAANWVEYVNGQVPATPDPAWTTTSYAYLQSAPVGYFAWLRKQRGHAAPYNIRNWEIGNENFFHVAPMNSVNVYRDTVNAYYPAMKSRAAQCGSVPIMIGVQTYNAAWNDTMINNGVFDALIVHWYLGQGSAETDAAITGNFSALAGIGNTGTAVYLHSKVSQARYDSTEFWLTEIGPDVNPPSNWESLDPWDGVWTARALLEAQKTYKPYSIFNWYTFSQGDDGYSAVNPSGQVLPVYWAYDMLTHFGRGGDSLLSTTGTVTNVDVYAARLSNGGLAICVLNKELTASSTVTFTVNGYTPQSSGTWWTWGRVQGGWLNDDRDQCQTPPVRHDTTGLGSTFSFSFPPMSVNVLQLSSGVAVDHRPHGAMNHTPCLEIKRAGDSFAVSTSIPGKLYLFTVAGALVAAMPVRGTVHIMVPSVNSALVARFVDENGNESSWSIAGIRMN